MSLELLRLKLQLLAGLSFQINYLVNRDFVSMEYWVKLENQILDEIIKIKDGASNCSVMHDQNHLSIMDTRISILLNKRQYLVQQSLVLNGRLLDLLKASAETEFTGYKGKSYLEASILDKSV